MNLNERLPEYGFYRSDGTLVPVSDLDHKALEYVKFTDAQLTDMLNRLVAAERYELCIGIRDELIRRSF